LISCCITSTLFTSKRISLALSALLRLSPLTSSVSSAIEVVLVGCRPPLFLLGKTPKDWKQERIEAIPATTTKMSAYANFIRSFLCCSQNHPCGTLCLQRTRLFVKPRHRRIIYLRSPQLAHEHPGAVGPVGSRPEACGEVAEVGVVGEEDDLGAAG